MEQVEEVRGDPEFNDALSFISRSHQAYAFVAFNNAVNISDLFRISCRCEYVNVSFEWWIFLIAHWASQSVQP